MYKISFSFLLAILCAGVIEEPAGSIAGEMVFLLLLKEVLVGIALGLTAAIMFYAVQLAGALIDLQIGFAMASLFDPTFGTTTQLTGHFKNIMAILFLLATNGHHLFIYGILSSFDWVALGATVPAAVDGRMSAFMLETFKQMFMISFLMAAPIIGTLFVVDVGLGIMAKTVPQMNIFAVFPPVKIPLYFFIYIIVMPSFFYLLKVLFETMFDAMFSILKIMGG